MFKEDILKVDNLSVKINNSLIVHNLSFELKKQDVLVILGPNGAGKSTLLRAIIGLIPYTGKIYWNTQHISYLPPQEFFERKDLPPLSIKDFFHFKNTNDQDINGILKAVGIKENILDKQFNQLSTGQFQRMTIAWALINKPTVLILDEPTSGIDIGGEETIYTLLHKFWNLWKLTIILVTHDLSIVWEHANKVICLNKKILCMGKPDMVLTPENLKNLYGSEIKYYKHNHHES